MRPRATASTGHSNLSLPIYCLHYISYLLPSQLKNTVLVLIINGLLPSVKNFRFFVQFDFHDLFLLQLIGKLKRKSSTIRHICKKKIDQVAFSENVISTENAACEMGEGRVPTIYVNERNWSKLDETARDFLIKEGYDPQYGARPMRRAVEKNIEDPLAEHLLRGDIKEGDTVKALCEPNAKMLKFISLGEVTPEAAGASASGAGI